MNKASTSSRAIKDAMDICVRTLEMLRATSTKLRGKYVSAGSDWSDTKYEQLGDIINECTASFDKAIRDLDGCLLPLSDMVRFVQEYEELSLSSGTPYSSSGFSSVPNRHMPIDSEQWSGERGNSIWRPTDEAVINDIRFYSREAGGREVDGIEYVNGYVDFSPVQVFQGRLNSRLYYRNDTYQFVDCTLELRAQLVGNPPNVPPDSHLMSFFDDEQLSAIMSGQARIPDYTWHHDVQAGRIQLVLTSIHESCPHEGGRYIWGGASSNR